MSYMMWTKTDALWSLSKYSQEEIDEFKALVDGLVVSGLITSEVGERASDSIVIKHFDNLTKASIPSITRERYRVLIPIIAGAYIDTGDVKFASNCEPYLSDRQKSLWIYLAQLCKSIEMGVPHIYKLLEALNMDARK